MDNSFKPSAQWKAKENDLLQLMLPNGYNELFDRQDTVVDAGCFKRSCDQTITGRGLTYNRALEIVQNEEYLEAADTDILRYNLDQMCN